MLGRKLLADPFLRMLLEELSYRQVQKEQCRLETATGNDVMESQGIIRGTRFFLELTGKEEAKREPLDRPDEWA